MLVKFLPNSFQRFHEVFIFSKLATVIDIHWFLYYEMRHFVYKFNPYLILKYKIFLLNKKSKHLLLLITTWWNIHSQDSRDLRATRKTLIIASYYSLWSITYTVIYLVTVVNVHFKLQQTTILTQIVRYDCAWERLSSRSVWNVTLSNSGSTSQHPKCPPIQSWKVFFSIIKPT